MTKREKQKYIKKHFSRKCRIVLADVRKTKYYKRRQERNNKISERRKHICYICFQKFFSKQDLDAHKEIHFCEKSNDTFSDDNGAEEECSSRKETRSSKRDELHKTLNDVGSDGKKLANEVKGSEVDNGKQTSKTEDLKVSTEKSQYKCIKCNIRFSNQMDVKAHPHTQYSCKYYCSQCDRQFNTKGGFIVHVLQHEMTNVAKLSYRCNKCPFSFDDCYKLKRHYATAHNIESNKTAQYAESSVNIRDNIPTNVGRSNEIIAENIEACSSAVSTEIPNNNPNMLDKYIKDCENPITGNIPIFDCDVCYDVFASEKALIRHKSLHKELEKKSRLNVSFLIEDDEIQLLQEDTSDKNVTVTNFRAAPKSSLPNFIATPMAQLTPMRLNSPSNIETSKPKILPKEMVPKRKDQDMASKLTSKVGNEPLQALDVKVDSTIDKTKITSEITDMLAGKRTMPKSVLTSQPGLVKPFRPVLKNQSKVPLSRMPHLQPITRNVASPQRPEIAIPAGNTNIVSENDQSKSMYVLCSQSTNQSTSMPFGGQSLMPIDSRSTFANPNTGILYHNQGETNPSTMMSTSRPNQFIINQQINTGGVVINPQTGGVPGGNFVFNQNVEGQVPTVQPHVLQSINGLQGVDGGKMFYVLMPSNQGGSGQPPVQLPSNPQIKQQRTVRPKPDSVMAERNSFKIKEKDVKEILNSDNHQTSKPYVTTANQDITIVDSNSKKVVKTSTLLETHEEENNESISRESTNDSEFIMPIITCIGTVAEGSRNSKEKVRKDPVSVYESEFAKFLEKSEEAKANERKTSIPTKEDGIQLPRKALRAARIHKQFTSNLTSDSNDDVIFLDDSSSSNESISKECTENSVKVSEDNAVNESKEDILIKPKIFVKKLSDLLGTSRTPVPELPITEKPSSTPFQHCCLRCNIPLKDWYQLRIHLKSKHNVYACVYNGCSIFNTLDEYRTHILQIHHCRRCNNDFGDLGSHQKECVL